MLADHIWKLKYTPDDGNLVNLFYVPALQDAERYDRLTGYFNAHALSLAARGIEELVRNDGRMRLIVGCTLAQPEIDAIEEGEQLRSSVERHLKEFPLTPQHQGSADALELLAFMVAHGFLDVKVAVPCDTNGKPVPADGIFHEKAGIIEDRIGDRIAWNGSLNETAAGWRYNWESINVYTSWGEDLDRVEGEELNFEHIWTNQAQRVIVLDVPDAANQDLMRFMPKNDKPARLKQDTSGKPTKPSPEKSFTRKKATEIPPALPPGDQRSRVWSFIKQAPALPNGGEYVGEATSVIEPWPHQVRAFARLYSDWPPKLLIADEVGLGKTIQAGMLLRQAWLAGRLKRVLILAPKAVLGQWQVELREKFNLNWPIYDGHKFVWYPSPAMRGRHERAVDPDQWHRESVVITSSHLMRRQERAVMLLNDDVEDWDLVVLDEAHHARRHAPGSQQEGGPNALLRLMQGLKEQTQGLVLLTATPMQVHPVEVWDLLHLLGLPPEWTKDVFLKFFKDIEQPNPASTTMDQMALLFQSVERSYGKVKTEAVQNLIGLSRFKTRKVLSALRDVASIPRRQLETEERRAAIKIIRSNTPLRGLISRHTRELLRRYFKAGMLTTPIAVRRVEDRFLVMTLEERALYIAVEDYIASTYNQASASERTAVGFVMTIYRRRLASSFCALRKTLQNHLDAIADNDPTQLLGLEEDAPDDEAMDEFPDADEVGELERKVLSAEEEADIHNLLVRIDRLPPDSKLNSLKSTLHELRQDGYGQTMVFTQYTDTMDFLREELLKDADMRLMCFSGRGGEIPSNDGTWHPIQREVAKRRFRDGEADVLLCTDAAAEGLNFQFCGALVNYDMPWNPMRVEQRIGRIDRLGQQNPTIRIVNLHYEDTVETDVYKALTERINLFETVVGRLQPILAQLPRVISNTVLSGGGHDDAMRAGVKDTIKQYEREAEAQGFNIDTLIESDLTMPEHPSSPFNMDDLDRIINSPDLMPPGTEVQPLRHREYGLLAPGMSEPLRVTTDTEYFEENSESLELWSPGNVLFQAPELLETPDGEEQAKSLKELLES